MDIVKEGTREEIKKKSKGISSHLNGTVLLVVLLLLQQKHSKWFFAVEIFCVFITVTVRCYLFIASFVLFHTMFYCTFLYQNAGHDGRKSSYTHREIHTHILCVIKFVGCASTWIQIICTETMGFRTPHRYSFFSTFHSCFFCDGLVLLCLFF